MQIFGFPAIHAFSSSVSVRTTTNVLENTFFAQYIVVKRSFCFDGAHGTLLLPSNPLSVLCRNNQVPDRSVQVKSPVSMLPLSTVPVQIKVFVTLGFTKSRSHVLCAHPYKKASPSGLIPENFLIHTHTSIRYSRISSPDIRSHTCTSFRPLFPP